MSMFFRIVLPCFVQTSSKGYWARKFCVNLDHVYLLLCNNLYFWLRAACSKYWRFLRLLMFTTSVCLFRHCKTSKLATQHSAANPHFKSFHLLTHRICKRPGSIKMDTKNVASQQSNSKGDYWLSISEEFLHVRKRSPRLFNATSGLARPVPVLV